ncbi:MAG: hypothetical protein ACRD0N_13425 [Acidimicrobiales bacterium]
MDPPSPRPGPAWLGPAAAAAAALAVVAVLAYGVADEVISRRQDGFCRQDHGIPGATRSEERTWWPLGEICRLHLADGTTLERHPGWSLTAFTAAWATAVAAGTVAPPRSARRRLAWAVAAPAVPLATLIQVVVAPASYSRLVSLTAISLGFGAIMATATAAAVWYVIRGRVMATVLGSWLAWGAIIFLQGKDAVGL